MKSVLYGQLDHLDSSSCDRMTKASPTSLSRTRAHLCNGSTPITHSLLTPSRNKHQTTAEDDYYGTYCEAQRDIRTVRNVTRSSGMLSYMNLPSWQKCDTERHDTNPLAHICSSCCIKIRHVDSRSFSKVFLDRARYPAQNAVVLLQQSKCILQ